MGRGGGIEAAGRDTGESPGPPVADPRVLESAGVDAAVDEEILPGDVAGLGAAQIRAQIAEFLGRPEAARRDRLLQIPLDVLDAPALLLRVELGVALQPVGPEPPGEDIVDGDVGGDGLARQPGDEAGEAAPRTVRKSELGDRRLYRARGDVDDAPEAPRHHPVHGRLDQLDRREHVRAHRLLPLLARELAEVPGRRAARVGDQDVGLRAGGERRDASLLAGDVGRHRDDGRAGRRAHVLGGLLQDRAVARDQRHATTLARQRGRAAPPQSLACAAHERDLAANVQFHDSPRKGPGYFAALSVTSTTPASTSAAPANCTGVMTSSRPIQPKKSVVTGPSAPKRATRLAPMRFSASEVMKTGSTVLTVAIAIARP